MRFKILNLILIFFVLISVITIIFPIVKSSGNEIYVNSDFVGYSDGSAEKPYSTINEALSIAEDGDTIYIFSGLYQESLVINKKIKLIGGIDEEETIIDTRFDRRYLVEILSDDVTIEGITFSDMDSSMTSPIGALLSINSNNNAVVRNVFKNNTGYGIYISPSANDNIISNNFINFTKSGIYVSSSSTNDIANNELHNSSEYGIYIVSSVGNNRLYSNTFYNCPSGVFIDSSKNVNITYNRFVKSIHYAIYLSQSPGGIITNNIIEYNNGDGLFIISSNCFIKNNTFQENRRGIYLSASDNIVKNNTFVECSASGIFIQSNANNNVLYHNKFQDNGVSAKDYGNNNIWYNFSEGNYWSDYNNVDKNLDKIGDVIYSKNGVVDKYPLGYFLKPPKKPSNPTPEDTETDVTLNINLEIHIEDPDSEELTVYFYRADTNTLIESQTVNPVYYVQNNTRVNCRFTLGFDTTFAWYVLVDDGLLQNISDTFFFYTTQTPPDNRPPVANPGGPYYAGINETINFDASNSYDPDGNIDFYRWNFGDGTSEILSISPTHTYLNSGTYNVVLTVIDDNGTSTTEVVQVAISPTAAGDKPPIADPSGPYNGEVGDSIRFDGSKSQDQDYGGSIVLYEWDFGDGITLSQQKPSHAYSYAGNFTVKLTVTDKTGMTGTKTTYALIKTKSSDESPGFELILAIILMLSISIILKKKKK